MARIRNISLSVLALAVGAMAQAYDDPQTVAWREICDNNYFWSLGLETPWGDPNTVLGIPMANVLCSDMAKDWDVFQRRLTAQDVALVKSGATAGSGANVFFSLYNRRTGVLRTFIWLASEQDAIGSYYSVRVNVQNGSSKHLDHSLLAYEGGNTAHTVVERMTEAKNTDRTYFTDRHVNNRWLIEDTHLSFDMNGAHSEPLYLDYLVKSHDVGNIKLTGTIGGDGQRAASLGIMSLATTLINAGSGGFNAGFNGTLNAGKKLISVGSKITEFGGNGQTLVDIGNMADKSLANKVGVVTAGYDIIKGFLGWSGGGQVGMAPSVLSVNGTIAFVRTTTNPRIPLPNANFIESQRPLFARTYNTTADKNLGLFVMNIAPEVKVWCVDYGPYSDGRAPYYYSRQYYVSISDPTCGLYVNPATGAKLAEIQVRPELSMPVQYVSSPDPHFSGTSNPAATASGNFAAPASWNKVAIGPRRKVYRYNDGSFTGPDKITFNLKIAAKFDVGRSETFDAINSYAPSLVSYAKTSSITTARDYNTCGQPDFLRTALEQGSSDLLIWSESNGPNWYTLFGYPGATGSSVAVSGKVGDNGNSAMSLKFTGSGASFRWKFSSETGYDKLQVLVDYVPRAEITGQTGWVTQDLSFPYGTHTITWNYIKDGSLQLGEDRGMVDQFVTR